MSGYGVIFPLWWDTAGLTWRAYTRHAFVQGLGDGSLPRQAFLSYLVQDYIFLSTSRGLGRWQSQKRTVWWKCGFVWPL